MKGKAMSLSDYLEQSAQVIQAAAVDKTLQEAFDQAVQVTVGALSKGLPVLICGNGGSACDALHIAGELVGRFMMERKPLNVIALSDNVSIITAVANDYSYDHVFSRQVEAYAKPGAVLIGLSTSGNSVNVIHAFEAARKHGMKTIAFTKKGDTKIASLSDVLIAAPASSTPLIQQIHICLYHYLCHAIEQEMFGKEEQRVQKMGSGH